MPPRSYCCIGIEDIKKTLSEIYGESKRIPLATILMDIEDDGSVKKAVSHWYVKEEDVKDHFGTLQGVLIVEAAAQSIVCIVKALRLFPDHKPAFLGLNSLEIHDQVYAGDDLMISIEDILWEGKKGSASVRAECNGRRVATISMLKFRANNERALRRLGLARKVA